MKKKRADRREAAVGNSGQDYVVGLVSGSLGAKQVAPSTGALSSLFSAAPSNTLVFVPAAKVELKSSHVKNEGSQTSSVKEASKPKPTKEKSAAEIKLQNREGALKSADGDDVQKSPKKIKRKAPEIDHNREALEDEQPTKRRRVHLNLAAERIKQKRTVFVGNLPTSCKKKDLKRIFKDQGAVESVRFRSVVREDPSVSRRLATIQRQVDPKKPSINAYVVFKEEEGAANALQRNGMEIERDVYIRVDKVSKHLSHDHKRSIFVGNLPYDIMELPLRQHFEDCGTVEAVRLIRDRNSGVGKGFGYILFEDTDAVMLALKLNGSQLLNRKIRVKRSVKKEKAKKGGGPAGRNAQEQRGKGAGKRNGSKSFTEKGFTERPKPAGKFPRKSPGMGNKVASFAGEMVDPTIKKGKGLKNRFKPKKKKHVEGFLGGKI